MTEREAAADQAFVDHDFIESVKDTGGWQVLDGDEWSRAVYLENGDQPSIKQTFVVRFEPSTAVVKEAYVAS